MPLYSHACPEERVGSFLSAKATAHPTQPENRTVQKADDVGDVA